VRPYLKKAHHKNRAGGVALGIGPEFKPQYRKKTKKEKEKAFHAIIINYNNYRVPNFRNNLKNVRLVLTALLATRIKKKKTNQTWAINVILLPKSF
jgi:hypothetical protein